ncbi:MAG: hypothetical protein ABSH51_13145 [Solirubrobacteraceae bacterium]
MKLADDSAINLVIMFLGIALAVFFTGVCVILAVKQTPPTQLWAAGGAISGALVGVLMPSPGEGSASAAAAAAADATHTAALDAALTASKQSTETTDPAAAAQAVASVRGVRAQIHATNAQLIAGQGTPAAAATAAQTAKLSVHALADNAQAAVVNANRAVAAIGHPALGRSADTQAVAAASASLAQAQTRQRILQSAADAADNATTSATADGITAGKNSGTVAVRTVWLLGGIFVVFLGLGVLLETANATTHAPLVDAGKTVIALASSAGAALVALFAPSPSSARAGGPDAAGSGAPTSTAQA